MTADANVRPAMPAALGIERDGALFAVPVDDVDAILNQEPGAAAGEDEAALGEFAAGAGIAGARHCAVLDVVRLLLAVSPVRNTPPGGSA